MNFTSGEALLEICQKENILISEAMIIREEDLFPEHDIMEQMKHAYDIMKAAVDSSLKSDLKSMGGLIGGEAQKFYQQYTAGNNICGPLIAKAVAYSLGVLEVNASMGLIVAAPTAGSSGVIPGVFLAVQEEQVLADEVMIKALYNAGAVGYLISRNATVAGAEGGCQAEVGTASAMAASALTEILGGTPEQCLDAAVSTITNMLGLVCDPIGGLVEVPCQKRNALGAVNAVISAQMSICGIKNVVPFDQVVEAMYRVGKSLPLELRETALGGIAATQAACEICSLVNC